MCTEFTQGNPRVRISALMGKCLSDFIPYYIYNAFLQKTT